MQLWWVVAVLVASALAAEDSVVATGAAAAAASHSSAADVVFTQAAVDAAIQQSVDATKKALTKKMEQEKQERARDSAERLATITKEATDKRQKLQERITATEMASSITTRDTHKTHKPRTYGNASCRISRLCPPNDPSLRSPLSCLLVCACVCVPSTFHHLESSTPSPLPMAAHGT